ncbi:hypothetical protein HY994_02970 [Candidatus Micrarchaeota archaeon]|nr:hypothetical protein [Candidatus Micrarchaeota archaeon]
MAVLLVAGLVLFGCAQGGSNFSASLIPASGASGQGSGFASATSAAPVSSGGLDSAGPSPSPGAYDTSGLDQVGPDIDDLDALSNDLSAGDVSPPPDEAG